MMGKLNKGVQKKVNLEFEHGTKLSLVKRRKQILKITQYIGDLVLLRRLKLQSSSPKAKNKLEGKEQKRLTGMVKK